jgi:hypothetical protein
MEGPRGFAEQALRRGVVPAAKAKEELDMSDPRFDRDPNRRPYANRPSTAGPGSVWVAAIVAILVVAGIAAYTYRNSMTVSNEPATTTGQSTRAPVSSPPASAPLVSTAPVTPTTPADPVQRP